MESAYILLLFFCFILFLFPRASCSTKMEESTLRLIKGDEFSKAFDPTRATQVSWQPRAFIYNGFLSDEECDHLINLAENKLEKSMVVNDETGEDVEGEERTSMGMFLTKDEDEIVTAIEDRIAAWTFLPPENGEPIQILRYEHGQKYEPHTDYFVDEFNQKIGGNRMATVLMYLSDVEKGGETAFPKLQAKRSQQKDDSWSDCAKTGYAVKPRKGDALLFFSLHPNASTDPNSLHASCPVIEGEKWSATKWIRVRPFVEPVSHSTMGDCVDKNDNCLYWAVTGECEKNPLYMVGAQEKKGHCRKSCKICSS